MRRGIAEAALVAIILAVAGGIAIGAVVINITVQGKERINIEACRSNVIAASKTAQLLKVTKCFTDANGHLEYSGNKKTYSKEIGSQIGQMLRDCRYQFGETDALPWKGYLFDSGSICFACSTFSLPSDAPDNLGRQFVINAMQEQKLRSGETYYDYVVKSAPFNDKDYLFIEEATRTSNLFLLEQGLKFEKFIPEFEKDREYAVLHFGMTQVRGAQFLGLADEAATIEEGSEGEFSSVFIMPIDKISNVCDISFTRYAQ